MAKGSPPAHPSFHSTRGFPRYVEGLEHWGREHDLCSVPHVDGNPSAPSQAHRQVRLTSLGNGGKACKNRATRNPSRKFQSSRGYRGHSGIMTSLGTGRRCQLRAPRCVKTARSLRADQIERYLYHGKSANFFLSCTLRCRNGYHHRRLFMLW